MANKPYEQDVILDADGQPIFRALERVREQINQIQRDVQKTAAAANKGVADYGNILVTQTKEMQQSMSQIRALAQGNNNAGYRVQDALANQRLGKATTQATEYARGIESASTAVDALRARLNKLNGEIAGRGSRGFGETLKQTDLRKSLEGQLRQVDQYEKALERLQNKAGRTSISAADQPGAARAANAVAAARQRLIDATMDPNRNSFRPELAGYQRSLNEFENYLGAIRTKQAQRLSEDRAYYRQAEKAESDSRNRTLSDTEKMWAARDRLANSARTSEAQRRKDEDRAWAAKAKLEQQDVASVAAAERDKQRHLDQTREKIKQTTAERMRLTEAERLGMAEAARANSGLSGSAGTGRLDVMRARVAAEDARAGLVERAREMKDLAALNLERQRSLRIIQEMRMARRAANSPEDISHLTRLIANERAYTTALDQRAAALRRAEGAQAQGNTGGAGAGGRSPLSTILSPGYAAAAVARTSVYGLAAGAAYGAFNAAQNSMGMVVQMEDELAKLQAIANATDGQMQQLKGSIYEVGESSRFSLVELAEVSQKLAQAGVSAGQMEGALRSITTLATASGSTTAETTDLVTAALGSFQLQASEAGRVADLMTTALNRTRLTVAQAGQAIQYVGATAYEQNITLDELLATAAAMAQAGIRSGSTIGTGLRQFLVDLQSPSEKLTEQFKLLGLSAQDVDVKVRGLPAVLDTLSQSGFGAAQAYGGLETRAAAAYLVLKNNTGLIDQMSLAMQEQGVAAAANEKAMGSLTAQWSRLKNIMSVDFLEQTEPVLEFLRTSVRAIADDLEEQAIRAEALSQRRARGWEGYVEDAGGSQVNAALSYWNDNLLRDMGLLLAQESEWEKAINSFFGYTTKAAEATKDWDTEIAVLDDSLSTQRGKISELESEYNRLLVQKDELIRNDVRSQIEMGALIQRFSGLSGHLTNTKNNYLDLTNAVRSYIQASQQALAADVAVQQSNLAQQSEQLRGTRGGLYAGVVNDAGYDDLPSHVKNALTILSRYGPGTTEFARATTTLADFSKQNATKVIGQKIDRLATNLSQGQSVATQARMLQGERQSLAAGATPEGIASTQAIRTITARLDQAQHADDKAARVANILTDITAALEKLDFTPKPEYAAFHRSQQQELLSLQQQAKAFITPTASQATASARAESAAARERTRAEREAEREAQRPRVQRGEIIDIVKDMYGDRVRVGSGERTAAEQNSLNRRGVTRATAATSDHSNGGIGQDFPVSGLTREQGNRMAAAIKARLKSEGIEAQVIYEAGGPNDGTGAHIHVGVKRGTRYANGNGPAAEDNIVDMQQYQGRMAKAQKTLDTKDLKEAIENASAASSTAAYIAAVSAAQLASAKVEESIREIAATELAGEGLGPEDPEYQVRMNQVEDEIAQLHSDTQEKLADAVLKNARATFAEIDKALEDQLRPGETAVKMASARVSGLGYASNEGRIPDYMKQMAERRVAQATETADRLRLGALPGAIAAKEETMFDAQARLNVLERSTAQYTEQQRVVEDLRRDIQTLREEEHTLAAALSAGSGVPLTFKQGMSEAIAAYREYNLLDRSFKDEVIYGMTGHIDQARTSIGGFFTDIFTGSRNALSAMGNMVKGMIDYMSQLAAQFVANKLFSLLLNVVGGAVAPAGAAAGDGTNMTGAIIRPFFKGGKVDNIPGYANGGKVVNGAKSHDSVLAKLAKDEWVVNSSAADSLGDEFMGDLNRRGAKAVTDRAQPKLAALPMPEQTTNVYVVAPDQKPSLGPKDVVVALQDELLNGESRKLVKAISQGG